MLFLPVIFLPGYLKMTGKNSMLMPHSFLLHQKFYICFKLTIDARN